MPPPTSAASVRSQPDPPGRVPLPSPIGTPPRLLTPHGSLPSIRISCPLPLCRHSQMPWPAHLTAWKSHSFPQFSIPPEVLPFFFCCRPTLYTRLPPTRNPPTPSRFSIDPRAGVCYHVHSFQDH